MTRTAYLWFGGLLLLGSGCVVGAISSGSTPVARAASPVAVDCSDLSEEDRQRGYQICSELARPIADPCDKPTRDVITAEGACARQLWVELCGTKNEDGTPTGLYSGNDCPECEELTKARQRKVHAGCP
jgi:hypothetical protein